LEKVTGLTRTPEPNRPTYTDKEGDYDLWGFDRSYSRHFYVSQRSEDGSLSYLPLKKQRFLRKEQEKTIQYDSVYLTCSGDEDKDALAVTFGTARRGLGWLLPMQRSPLLSVYQLPNVTAHPSTAIPTSYYSMWRYNYLCTLKR